MKPKITDQWYVTKQAKRILLCKRWRKVGGNKSLWWRGARGMRRLCLCSLVPFALHLRVESVVWRGLRQFHAGAASDEFIACLKAARQVHYVLDSELQHATGRDYNQTARCLSRISSVVECVEVVVENEMMLTELKPLLVEDDDIAALAREGTTHRDILNEHSVFQWWKGHTQLAIAVASNWCKHVNLYAWFH